VKLDIPERVDLLPRLLLRGETGVGKTLVARYLHNRSGSGERLLRIPIPEYLGKEDMFEYDLFGYMRGAYTDAKEADRQTSRSRNQC
jgi:DNA-binding NtrC family response regulator